MFIAYGGSNNYRIEYVPHKLGAIDFLWWFDERIIEISYVS